MNQIRSICVFCGASTGGKDIYRLTAETLGRELVSRGIRLVYGAGSVGLMGVIARTVHERGGEVLGIIPEPLIPRARWPATASARRWSCRPCTSARR